MSATDHARNWKLWYGYRASDMGLAEVGAALNVSATRVAQICHKYDGYVRRSLLDPTHKDAENLRQYIPEGFRLIITDEEPEVPGNKNRPWSVAMDGPIFNPWTGVPIPEAAAYCTSGRTYYYRTAKIGEDGAVLVAAPKDLSKPGSKSAKPDRPTYPSDTPISEIFTDVRAINCLLNDNRPTLGDLVGLTNEYLLALPNLGRRTLRYIRGTLSEIGFEQPSTIDPNSEIEVLRDKYNKVRRKLSGAEIRIAALEHDLFVEKNYTSKLRSILSKLTGDMSIRELREVGINVDLRVTRGDAK